MLRLLPKQGLKLLKAEDVGITVKDYGNQQADLNFAMNGPVGAMTGVLNIGLQYESDQKLKYHGAGGWSYCLNSMKYMPYLEKVRASWLGSFGDCITGSALETLRVAFICGAHTLPHTDQFRGVTDNYFLPHGEGCQL
jgi:hypothetical protein